MQVRENRQDEREKEKRGEKERKEIECILCIPNSSSFSAFLPRPPKGENAFSLLLSLSRDAPRSAISIAHFSLLGSVGFQRGAILVSSISEIFSFTYGTDKRREIK